MPRTLQIHGGVKSQVATEEELLEFANAVREAGGANVIDALLPSNPGISHSCLIANALNFSCEIQPLEGKHHYSNDPFFKDGSAVWCMIFPHNMSEEKIRDIISKVPGGRVAYTYPWNCGEGEKKLVMRLPKHIGNAADAFDHKTAFQNYVKENI